MKSFRLNASGTGAVPQVLLVLVAIALTIWSPLVGALVLVLLVLPALIAGHLGNSRGRSGWMWGFFLGWLGVLIVACMRPRELA